MQMGHDFQDGSQGVVPQAGAGAFAAPWLARGGLADEGSAGGLAAFRPEWASLRARFLAIHALRRAIDSAPPPALPAGTFRESAEAVLASARRGEGGSVNLVCSANGKAADGIVPPLSPISPTRGDRGPR